mgnify:CR=1 FL=1|jgi:phosphoglycolate phosphatase
MSAVFLDLDGTLIDPKVGITTSIRHALAELGAEVPHADELTWCIGPPLRDCFRALLGEGADLDAAVALYRARYAADGLFEADIYDGVGEMLDGLRATGLPLYLATSKPHVFATTIAEEFGLSHYLNGLFGSELDGTHSDKTELLAHALAETGADPARSVMVGDRRHDVFGARNTGLIALGALWGFADPDELHLAEADALAGAPGEVPEIVADILGLEG